MRSCQLSDLVAFLVWDETECQFCHGVAGDDRFRPLALITAANPVDLRGWPCPKTLQRIVTSFAEEFRRAGFFENFLVAIDRKLAPRCAFPIFQRFNAIVETSDRNATLAVVQRS